MTDNNTSCPCKHFISSLSSATAAEYGDLAALSRRIQLSSSSSSSLNKHITTSNKNNYTSCINNGGITPLHLAAQHGHALAVSLLLEKGNVDVDTGLTRRYDGSTDGGGVGVTPLHRAAFSGALSCMQQLISHGANLLAKDESFGDERTPLHKAVAGGRPMAVHLILVALKQQHGKKRSDDAHDDNNRVKKRELLQVALEAKDAHDQTPIELAKYYCAHLTPTQLEDEKRSVRRWDAVAGGDSADWKACLRLLITEEGRIETVNNDTEDGTGNNMLTTSSFLWNNVSFLNQQQQQQDEQMNKSESHQERNSNLDTHNETSCQDGRCCSSANIISQWESEFRKAFITASLSPSPLSSNEAPPHDDSYAIIPLKSQIENASKGHDDDNYSMRSSSSLQSTRNFEINNAFSNTEMDNHTTNITTTMGKQCENCGQHSIALYRSLINCRLVCRDCRRRKR